jgi:SAM-dependent methyltransferase
VTFKDHFSQRAALYATCRPHYPESLFRYLASVSAAHDLAIDCGTGNGQAAVGLAEYFIRVVGIDPSSAQIDKATQRPNIEYRIAAAEQTGAEVHSADLVTAAQALHWLDAPAFFAEATRLLKPDGAIAVWGYGDPVLDTQRLHDLLHTFNRIKLEAYWFTERRVLLDGYRTIDFPFVELRPPTFELRATWTLAELLGYLRTWSSAARYLERHGVDPVSELEPSLTSEWGDPPTPRLIRWPLHLRVGKLHA